MIVYEAPGRYRGTIEVYVDNDLWMDSDGKLVEAPEWRWRCKANNNAIVASGQGYNRKAGALNAIDAQYSVKLTDEAAWSPGAQALVVPWRLVVRDRHGDITTTGAVY
ncbi:hypothetical protein SEA_HORUS_74 [Gordonia phage Horus]|uniref:DUF1508 domain-containing protein n=3 Tax=Caudoviricetes TaxID=2731619 RepID=A0A345L179_9CAUD|nr:hypothetical protein HOT72_gp072 [Gordonia phage Apricot]YP_009808311.1 hypothetical protein HOT93_gp076 [Gordonia phage Horus]YP_009808412.1 hypothetical protein HOT94_gp071 [Gordonia phage Phistory]WNM69779.1 hypothetical protein SEA_CRATER_72 [Gordonia phage Crater]AXH49031.1 hypothetical protein SEA_APRICOT_72 [Gordonia phage Apricot]AXQ63926.1 hypothetical protein SEA_HORUS_74 [Gordonia phage Horus]AXQ64776.1 hypothetical protein SEA_PHISTORY_71 [Gordonia phage Phistory]